MTFEFYGNEEVKTIDEIEEVEVIEGEDGDENPYNHYERTRHLFDVPEKSKKESSQRKKYVFASLVHRLQIFLGLRRNEKKIKLHPLSWLQKPYQNEHRECLLLN